MMEISYSSMNENKLFKEYMLLSKVYQNLKLLSIYNPKFERAIQEVDADLKKIKGQLFFRYKKRNKINLETLVFTGSELQSRMEKYI
jgi:hypothetical protein